MHLLGTTFSQFVYNTRFLGRKRGFALRQWLREWEGSGRAEAFEGTEEEIDVVRDHIEGRCIALNGWVVNVQS
jgi:hypothetical protein